MKKYIYQFGNGTAEGDASQKNLLGVRVQILLKWHD